MLRESVRDKKKIKVGKAYGIVLGFSEFTNFRGV